ncbi:MAG: hypothetical protein LBT30_05930 [Clostridiales bacterium]|jgi:hypothetical protein|nr:hypothetical protein [Clostridiales bacterium]
MKKLYKVIITAVLIAVFASVSAAILLGYKPDIKPKEPTEGTAKIRPTDVLDMILKGVQLAALPEDGYNFNVDSQASFTVSDNNGIEQTIGIKVNMSFDLDPSMSTAGNMYIIELTKKEGETETALLSLYYKDNLYETPYLYVAAGEQKHAVKFTSVKRLAQTGAPGLFSPTAAALSAGKNIWTTDSVLGLLQLGEYQKVVNLIINNFVLNGANSIVKNPYIKDDKRAAGFEIDMDNVKALLDIAAELIGGVDGVASTIDAVLDAFGVKLSFSQIKDIVNNIPEMEMKVSAAFDGAGALTSLKAGVKFLKDTGIAIDAADGSNLADFVIPGGKTVLFELSKFEIKAGAPLFTDFPSGFDANSYSKHNLINFEMSGVAQIESFREIDKDGNYIWETRPGYDYTVEADLDPFALLNGVDKAHLEDSIMAMGKFRIFVWEMGTTATKLELVFDPSSSGTDSILVQFQLLSFAALAGTQKLSFDVSDLIDYISGEPQAAGTARTADTGTVNANALDVGGAIGNIENILNLLGFEYEKLDDGIALSLFPRYLDALASFQNELMSDWGERLYVTLGGFSYGTMSPNADIYTHIATSSNMFFHSMTQEGVPDANKVITNYKYGQKFQDGYSTVDMMITYRYDNNSKLSTLKKSMKVIGTRGFDSYKTGLQEVTLFLIIPPGSGQTGVYDAFADGNLPYGIVKYTYTVMIAAPETGAVYSFVSDNIKAGSKVFDKEVKKDGMTMQASDRFFVKSFALYTKDPSAGGVLSNGIDASGKAISAGKYYIEVVLSDGNTFAQDIYVNEIYIPNLSEKLVRGRPSTDIYGYTKYYDTVQGAVVTQEIIPSLINTSASYLLFLNIGNGIIAGNGFQTTDLQKPNVGLKYTYSYASGGNVVTTTATYDGLRVKIYDDLLEVQADSIASSYKAHEGGYVGTGNWIHRATASGQLYTANLTYGSGLKFINGAYQIWDVYGNVIADKVRIVVLTGVNGTDVTEQYYDADTGKFRVRTDGQGNPILIGAQSASLRLEIYASYGSMPEVRMSGSFVFYASIANIASTASTMYAYGQIYALIFQIAPYTPGNTYGATQFIRYDYIAEQYYVMLNAKKYYIDASLFAENTTTAIADAFDMYGGFNISHTDNRKYYLTFEFVYEGTPVYFKTAVFTINGTDAYRTRTSQNAAFAPSFSYVMSFEESSTTYATFYLKYDAVGGAVYATFLDKDYTGDFKIYNAADTLLNTADIISSDGKAVGAKAFYTVEFSYKVTIGGVEKEVVFKAVWQIY